MVNKIKVVVLDVLKPHKPDIIEFGAAIEKEKGVKCVNLTIYAVDEKTESVKVAIDGDKLDMKKIEKVIEDHGAVVHSIDKAVVGDKRIVQIPDLK